MSDEEEIFREDDEDTEMEKGSSDLDFVRERLEDESGGMEAYRQALEAVQDPQLKEILQAIQSDEQKHQAALEQWMQEHGEGEAEGPEEEAAVEEEPEDLPEEEEEPLDKEDDIFPEEEEETSGDDASDLIDDIREVLAEHEAEKAEDEEPEEDEDEEDEDLPEFLKSDEEEEDEDEVSKVMKSYRVPIIVAKGSDQQIVYGVVSEPNVIDLQGDRLSKSEIRAACHKFMQTGQRIGKEHSGVAKASIIESYIAPTDFKCNGQVVKSGSWVMAVKIHDNDLWQAVKKGDITGFSIAGTGTRTPF
jgi:hypothetical protein